MRKFGWLASNFVVCFFPSTGYQPLYKTADKMDSYYETLSRKPSENVVGLQRNAPVYWTLQNRRPIKPQAQTVISRDDLYATPLKRSERQARAQQQQAQQHQQPQNQQQYAVVNKAMSSSSINTVSSLSPLVQRNRSAFLCSTPLRNGTNLDSQLPADNIPAKQPTSRLRNWDDNSPERLNTCADRIGQSKTSLMDFKKLLLAKSAKTSTIPKKISAVELLKKPHSGQPLSSLSAGNSPQNSATTNSSTSATQLNSSMKLLDLSGSPKTFANRRMLRQGQFGSPSKQFVPKMKSSPNNWRSNSVQRTDIMSTTIPEANSEEDHSGNSLHSSTPPSFPVKAVSHENLVDTESLNLKRNIFLQTEENNFMRAELRSSFNRSKADSNKYVTTVQSSSPLRSGGSVQVMPATSAATASNPATATTTAAATAAGTAAAIASMPALETAL